MSKLNIDQKTIKDLLINKKSDFLIPDYQRPYAWTDEECDTLWSDIFTFAFPDDDYTKFDSANDEYFLGPIVTFKNTENKLEIIDEQQRLTTIMLLLRAFYSKFDHMKDPQSVKTSETIAKCIWKTDEFESPDINQLKIDSQVASDDDKDEFLDILKNGVVSDSQKSKYAKNFSFFQEKITKLVNEYPSYTAYMATRILNNVILLPIEAESQDTALRIFSTLNDRGLPLSDADIFKSQFYKYYSDLGKKDEFIKRWKSLEALCGEIFTTSSGTAMDELFTRYMYYERARQGNKNTTTESLRNFYEKDAYKLLKSDATLVNMEKLAAFWDKVDKQDSDYFTKDVLKNLFVLKYAPNSMWANIVSVYYMSYKDSDDELDNEAFKKFLDLIIAFIWAYSIERPGVNALRSPVYPELINIVNGKAVTFDNYKFDKSSIKNKIESYTFSNDRPITKSMLTWWAFSNSKQELIDIETKIEIEHIYAKKRDEVENSLKDKNNLEALGNKSLLEKRINIRAADYRFIDKQKHYKGFINSKGIKKEATQINELLNLADKKIDFLEPDISNRTHKIIDAFINYLEVNNLLI